MLPSYLSFLTLHLEMLGLTLGLTPGSVCQVIPGHFRYLTHLSIIGNHLILGSAFGNIIYQSMTSPVNLATYSLSNVVKNAGGEAVIWVLNTWSCWFV